MKKKGAIWKEKQTKKRDRPGWMTYGDWTFFNHPIFLTVFQGFLYINLQHIMATHDVSHVWKGVGEHR